MPCVGAQLPPHYTSTPHPMTTTTTLTHVSSALYRWAVAADQLSESYLVAQANSSARHYGFTDALQALDAIEKRTSARWFHHSPFYHLFMIISEREDGYRRSSTHYSNR